jgi:hypothetical protein
MAQTTVKSPFKPQTTTANASYIGNGGGGPFLKQSSLKKAGGLAKHLS